MTVKSPIDRSTEDKVINILRYTFGSMGFIWASLLLTGGNEGPPLNVTTIDGVIKLIEVIILVFVSLMLTVIYNYKEEQRNTFHKSYLHLWYLLYKIRQDAPTKDMFQKIDEWLLPITADDANYIKTNEYLFSGDYDEDFNHTLRELKQKARNNGRNHETEAL